MTKGRGPGQVVGAGAATCPWDPNRMTQLISWAGSLGSGPPGGEEGAPFTLLPALLLMAARTNRKPIGHRTVFTASCDIEVNGVVAALRIPAEDGEVKSTPA